MILPFDARIKCPVGAAENQNLNDIFVRKTVKCHHLNLISGVLSIALCDGYT
jgi:hypothetical protein